MTDKSKDEKLTEEDALDRAKKEGIEFEDFYVLSNPESFEQLPDRYDTEKEAKAALRELNVPDSWQVSQIRTRIYND